MRFVQIKSEAAQAAAVVFRARDLLVSQRTQIINALRGHLAEFGLVVAKGPAHLGRLLAQAEDYARSLPQTVRPIFGVLIEALHSLDEKIAVLDVEISRRAEEDEDARRVKTIPGIGPITAAAISALAPPAQSFSRGRDFAAWLGLSGKQRLGGTSKRGERTIRRLLIIGASAVVRWAARKGAPEGSWLQRMLTRKPRMLVAVALANKMARIVWALLARGGIYRTSIAAT